jgi:hypothetical protein
MGLNIKIIIALIILVAAVMLAFYFLNRFNVLVSMLMNERSKLLDAGPEIEDDDYMHFRPIDEETYFDPLESL